MKSITSEQTWFIDFAIDISCTNKQSSIKNHYNSSLLCTSYIKTLIKNLQIMQRVCSSYEMKINNISELEHHLHHCHVRLHDRSRKIFWWKLSSSSESSLCNSMQLIWRDHETAKWDSNSNNFHDESIQMNIEDENQEYMLINDFTEEHMNIEMNNADLNQNIKHISSRIETIQLQTELFFTSSALQVEIFIKTIDRDVETTVNVSKKVSESLSLNSQTIKNTNNNQYYSFQCKANYAFTHWLYQIKIIKDSVNQFFQDLRLRVLHQHVSFHDANKWLTFLHQISYDVKNNEWHSWMFTVKFSYKEVQEEQHCILYCDIIETLRFLLNHSSFQDELIYALVQHYNVNNFQVYNEMHIADWWWKTQKKLSDDAIMISLLIFINKTVLTEHQDDLSAWFIYLTIENLNRRTRHAQKRSRLILLRFLLIVDNDNDDIKSKIWHMMLLIILKRMLNMYYHALIHDFTCNSRWSYDQKRHFCSLCRQ